MRSPSHAADCYCGLCVTEGEHAAYFAGYEAAIKETMATAQAAKPAWRCAKTDPPKDDLMTGDERCYLVQWDTGAVSSMSSVGVRKYQGRPGIVRWLDYPDPPPVQSEEEKAAEAAFQEWYRTLGQNIQAQPKWTAFEAWQAALAYARSKEKGQP